MTKNGKMMKKNKYVILYNASDVSFWASISIIPVKQDNYIHLRGLFPKLDMACE